MPWTTTGLSDLLVEDFHIAGVAFTFCVLACSGGRKPVECQGVSVISGLITGLRDFLGASSLCIVAL